jgi:hypothetical protein
MPLYELYEPYKLYELFCKDTKKKRLNHDFIRIFRA